MNADLTPSQAGYLLEELCVELGFCLPPSEHTRLQNEPPSTVEAFTDAVFMAEGLDPSADKQLRRQVRERIEEYLSIASKGAGY